jgi:hypothetical protein
MRFDAKVDTAFPKNITYNCIFFLAYEQLILCRKEADIAEVQYSDKLVIPYLTLLH